MCFGEFLCSRQIQRVKRIISSQRRYLAGHRRFFGIPWINVQKDSSPLIQKRRFLVDWKPGLKASPKPRKLYPKSQKQISSQVLFQRSEALVWSFMIIIYDFQTPIESSDIYGQVFCLKNYSWGFFLRFCKIAFLTLGSFGSVAVHIHIMYLETLNMHFSCN